MVSGKRLVANEMTHACCVRGAVVNGLPILQPVNLAYAILPIFQGWCAVRTLHGYEFLEATPHGVYRSHFGYVPGGIQPRNNSENEDPYGIKDELSNRHNRVD